MNKILIKMMSRDRVIIAADAIGAASSAIGIVLGLMILNFTCGPVGYFGTIASLTGIWISQMAISIHLISEGAI